MYSLATKMGISTNLGDIVIKFSGAIQQTPILGSLHSRVYSNLDS